MGDYGEYNAIQPKPDVSLPMRMLLDNRARATNAAHGVGESEPAAC